MIRILWRITGIKRTLENCRSSQKQENIAQKKINIGNSVATSDLKIYSVFIENANEIDLFMVFLKTTEKRCTRQVRNNANN